jgi:acyl dehydratase
MDSTVREFKRTFTQKDFDRFATLSGDDNPIHIDPDFAANTRFGRTVAHGMLLYSTLSGYLGTQYPGPGSIQVYQEMTFHSPTFVGEQVIFQIEVVSEHPEPGVAEFNTSVIRPNQEFGLKGKTLLRMPGKSEDMIWKPPIGRANGQMTDQSFKGLEVGQFAQLQRQYSKTDLAEYVSVSGDSNPIFTNAEYARSAGFDDIPLPGGLLGAMYSCLLGTQLPGRGTNWLKQSMHYPAPTYIGQLITAQVEITRLRSEKNLVNLRSTCTNSDGDIVCDGETLVYVADLV